jgi:hypothetical protein
MSSQYLSDFKPLVGSNYSDKESKNMFDDIQKSYKELYEMEEKKIALAWKTIIQVELLEYLTQVIPNKKEEIKNGFYTLPNGVLEIDNCFTTLCGIVFSNFKMPIEEADEYDILKRNIPKDIYLHNLHFVTIRFQNTADFHDENICKNHFCKRHLKYYFKVVCFNQFSNILFRIRLLMIILKRRKTSLEKRVLFKLVIMEMIKNLGIVSYLHFKYPNLKEEALEKKIQSNLLQFFEEMEKKWTKTKLGKKCLQKTLPMDVKNLRKTFFLKDFPYRVIEEIKEKKEEKK